MATTYQRIAQVAEVEAFNGTNRTAEALVVAYPGIISIQSPETEYPVQEGVISVDPEDTGVAYTLGVSQPEGEPNVVEIEITRACLVDGDITIDFYGNEVVIPVTNADDTAIKVATAIASSSGGVATSTVNTKNILSAATANCTVSFTNIDGTITTTDATILENDTAEQIAAKLRAVTPTGCTISGAGVEVILTATEVGNDIDTIVFENISEVDPFMYNSSIVYGTFPGRREWVAFQFDVTSNVGGDLTVSFNEDEEIVPILETDDAEGICTKIIDVCPVTHTAIYQFGGLTIQKDEVGANVVGISIDAGTTGVLINDGMFCEGADAGAAFSGYTVTQDDEIVTLTQDADPQENAILSVKDELDRRWNAYKDNYIVFSSEIVDLVEVDKTEVWQKAPFERFWVEPA